jgi:hypothetical protein
MDLSACVIHEFGSQCLEIPLPSPEASCFTAEGQVITTPVNMLRQGVGRQSRDGGHGSTTITGGCAEERGRGVPGPGVSLADHQHDVVTDIVIIMVSVMMIIGPLIVTIGPPHPQPSSPHPIALRRKMRGAGARVAPEVEMESKGGGSQNQKASEDPPSPPGGVPVVNPILKAMQTKQAAAGGEATGEWHRE